MARRIGAVAGWAVLFPLLALAVTRLLHVDDRRGTVYAVQTLTLAIYLPAYVVALIAARVRRRALALVAVAIVSCHLAWTWGDLPWSRTRTPTASGPAFTIATLNARFDSPDHVAVARTAAALSTDVITFEEFSPRLMAALAQAGLPERYPYRVEDPRDDAFGSAIYSRRPIESPTIVQFAGLPAASVVVGFGDATVNVVAIHTIQPLADLPRLIDSLDDAAEFAARADGPLVLAGDFNSTRQHRPFRRLVARGRLTDAHRATGRSLARTWPVGWPIGPFALLDHVLVSEGVEVRSTREFAVPGSDHFGVVASLRLPASPAS